MNMQTGVGHSPKVLAQEQSRHLLSINDDGDAGLGKDSTDYRNIGNEPTDADARSDGSGEELANLMH